MKTRHISIVLLMAIILTACSCTANNSPSSKLLPSEVNFASALIINSPEGLAKEASYLYMGMVNGTLDMEASVQALIHLSSAASAKQLAQFREEFISQINDTNQYLTAIEDKIIKYQYAQTQYSDDGSAIIKRIQIHENGKKYYFEQRFILENDEWKIASDNLIDAFELKTKFLFWYI